MEDYLALLGSNASTQNTRKQYDPKATEFLRWLDNHPKFRFLPFHSKYVVDEEKLVVFLFEEVFNRRSRVKRKGGSETVGIHTVKAYLTAITNLWSIQTSMKVSNRRIFTLCEAHVNVNIFY
jgi:hypothetical protein